jgi:predicted Zn-dependent protease
LVLAQPGDSAQRLHSALIGGGQQAEARRLAADWRQRHPDDLLFAQYLGDIALAEGHADAAEAFYREVLAKRPQDPVALNNLAYTLALQKKPGAVTLARQALLAAPDAPAVLDTLAFCLAAEGELPQALLAQGKAVQAAPEAPMLRLQLARLQLQAGDKSGARAELAVLARLGSGFARQAEVAALLKSAGT